MTTYATLNPVLPKGSTDPRDLKDNAENFDVAVNAPGVSWVDRLGVIRLSWAGIEAQFANFLINQGFQYLGDYDLDGPLTIGAPNQVFSKNGTYWRPGPDLVLPYTTVNNWAVDEPKFLVAGDGVLRNELTSTALDKGISLLPGAQRIVSTIAVLRTVPATGGPDEVKVVRYQTGGPVCNSEYFKNTSDITTADDGFRNIRGPAGVLYTLKTTGWATLPAAGAMMDGVTDDAEAWERFAASDLNLAGYGSSMTSRMILFPSPTPRTIRGINNGFKLFSKANTDHETTFRSVNPVGLTIENFDVDANSFNRTGALTTRTIALEISSGTDCQLTNCIGRNVIGGPTGIPGVCIATSGSGLRVNTRQCKAFNGGTAERPADGFFCSSSYSTNTDNYAENCFDTGGVVESCSYSGFTNLVSKNCSAVAAISNAVGVDTYGCYLDNVHGENWRSLVTGGVQILCAAAGGLIDCRASLTLTAVSYGDGPAVNFRETSTGRINGFDIQVCIRGASGTAQGVLGTGLRIRLVSPSIGGANDSAIQFGLDSTVTIIGGEIYGGTHSITGSGHAKIVATGVQCSNPTGYCMYAYENSSIYYNGVVPFAPGSGYAGKDPGANLSMFGGLGGGLALPAAVAGAAAGTPVSKVPFFGPTGETLGFANLYPS
ncbi:hypothetical protein F2A38_15740 [Pseudomonas chlororaphis]|uniref:Uncharacterized protein n=1 Tax=Pseudomonas chlororaphis TaxID=587753 RepID=A0AB34C4N1_9PSED|nr:hypothetical protein [Pseudomonas chlororaphis]KAA5841983.1 hypothetical protein F2A38_15740 [Pseudomonas chlororaphis]